MGPRPGQPQPDGTVRAGELARDDRTRSVRGSEPVRRPPPPPFDPGPSAKELYEAMHGGATGWGTDEPRLFRALEGKSPEQMSAIRREYRAHYRRDLDADVRSELSGAELSRAENLLRGDPAAADADRLHHAMAGAGTDEAAIFSTLEGKDAGQIDAIRRAYSNKHGTSLDSAIDSELSGAERDRARALLRGDRAGAEAASLHEAISGAGTDEAAIYRAFDHKSAPEREAIIRAYGQRYGSGPEDRLLERRLRQELSGAELDRAEALVAGDQAGADAAKVRHAMTGGFLGLGTDTAAIQETFEGQDAASRQAIVSAYDARYGRTSGGRVVSDLDSALRSEMGDHEYGKTRALIDRGQLSDTEQLYYAVAGAGTDEAAIRSALQGKSREEIDALRVQYRRDFPGRDLDADLRGDLSGRDSFDVSQLLRGKPRTLDEALERANERWTYERGGAANAISRTFMDRISPEKGELLDSNMRRANEIRSTARAQGRELTAAERAELQQNLGWAEMDVDTYRTAKDSAADTAGTVAATAASIAVVVGTAGTATPVVVALAAAGTGAVARVGTKAAIGGAGYGIEEGAADFGIGAVDGGFSAIGAGAGQALARTALQSSARSALARGGVRGASREVVELAGRDLVERSALRRAGLGAIEGASDGVIGGAAGGAAQEALRDGTWDRGFVSGLERVGAGAGTGAGLGLVAGGVAGGGVSALRRSSDLVDEAAITRRFSEGSNHWNTIGTYDEMLTVNRALEVPQRIDLTTGGVSRQVEVIGARSARELAHVREALERMEQLGATHAIPQQIHVRSDLGAITDPAGRSIDGIGGLGGPGTTMIIARGQLKDPLVARSVIFHEAGHNVDTNFGWLATGRGGGLFGQGDSVSHYASKNAREDFAETHRVLIQDWEKITTQPDLFVNNGTDIGRKLGFIADEVYGLRLRDPATLAATPGRALPPLPPAIPGRPVVAAPSGESAWRDLPRVRSELTEVEIKLPKAEQKLEHQLRQLEDLRARNYQGPKPPYENPGHHDPLSPNFRGGGSMTTPLPPDAAEVYARAIPEPGLKGDVWWGRSQNGDWYRFAGGERGVHWNGATGRSGGGRVIRDHEVPGSVQRQLQLEETIGQQRARVDELRARRSELEFQRDYGELAFEEARDGAIRSLDRTVDPSLARMSHAELLQTAQSGATRSLREEAAFVLSRIATPDLAPGQVLTRAQLARQAELLGARVESFDTLYRIDTRTPEELLGAGGLRPNPSKPARTLWEHVSDGTDGGGNLVSTSKAVGNDANLRSTDFPMVKVSGPTDAEAAEIMSREVRRGDPLPEPYVERIFEYRLRDLEGVDVQRFSRHNADEAEVVAREVQAGQIDAYREIRRVREWEFRASEYSDDPDVGYFMLKPLRQSEIQRPGEWASLSEGR